MHFVGMAGVPRRYYQNTNFPMFDELTDIQVLMTVFAIITAGAQLVFAFNFVRSIFYGKRGPVKIHGRQPLLSGLLPKNIFMVTGMVRFLMFTDGLMITVRPMKMGSTL